MSIVKLQQAYADQVLAMIERIDPFAIIAGGAPRDWYLGREATDLDVYFHPNPSWDTFTIYEQVKAAGFKLPEGYRDFGEAGIAYGKCADLKIIFEPLSAVMPVQLMCMSKPTFESVISSFAVDLSCAWYKGGGMVVEEGGFLKAVEFKCITRINAQYASDDRYIQKICKKFPDYTYYESPRAFYEGNKDVEDEDESESMLNILYPSFDNKKTNDEEDWIDGRELAAF